MTLKAMAIKEGLTDSAVSNFEYTVFDPEQGIQIHHLQGAGHQSPILNEKVADIEGIVTMYIKSEVETISICKLLMRRKEND